MLPSAVVTSYCTYLLYSALASEPSEYECNPRGSETGAGAGSRGGVAEIASTALTLASVAYGALRAGSADFFGGVDGDGDDGDGDDEEEEEEEEAEGLRRATAVNSSG